MSTLTRPSLVAVMVEACKSPAEIDTALAKAGFEPLSDQERATLDACRAALINGLNAKGKSTSEISGALALAGYDVLNDGEVQALALLNKMAADAKQVPPAEPSADSKKKAKKDAKSDAMKAALMQVVGKKDGKDVTMAQAHVTQSLYQMVDIMKVLAPEVYVEYRKIKYPGDVESLATPETKRKAYLFAVEQLFNLFKV